MINPRKITKLSLVLSLMFVSWLVYLAIINLVQVYKYDDNPITVNGFITSYKIESRERGYSVYLDIDNSNTYYLFVKNNQKLLKNIQELANSGHKVSLEYYNIVGDRLFPYDWFYRLYDVNENKEIFSDTPKAKSTRIWERILIMFFVIFGWVVVAWITWFGNMPFTKFNFYDGFEGYFLSEDGRRYGFSLRLDLIVHSFLLFWIVFFTKKYDLAIVTIILYVTLRIMFSYVLVNVLKDSDAYRRNYLFSIIFGFFLIYIFMNISIYYINVVLTVLMIMYFSKNSALSRGISSSINAVD